MTEPVADPSVTHEFRRRRRRQLMATPFFVAAMLAVFLSLDPELAVLPPEAGGAGFLVIIGLVVFSRANWRCPACRSYLGRSLRQRFCSSCGARLVEA